MHDGLTCFTLKKKKEEEEEEKEEMNFFSQDFSISLTQTGKKCKYFE